MKNFKYEYIIAIWYEAHHCWCLETIVGYDIKRAFEVLKKLREKNPNECYVVRGTNPAETWWNKWGTN